MERTQRTINQPTTKGATPFAGVARGIKIGTIKKHLKSRCGSTKK